MTTTPTTDALRVNGATLHYEVRGAGPPLLLVPGGTGGADSFEDVVDDLAAGYTVVTYDPRGMSRSTLDDPDAEQTVAEHADDAFRLLGALSPDQPARVFGTSSGAVVGLHLLAAHPERVTRLVAHEPPVVEVLPDAAEHRALVARIRKTFRDEGVVLAMEVFAEGLRRASQADQPPAETPLPPRAAARVERSLGDVPFFVGRIVPAFMSYAPDVERLAALADRLVLAGGRDSRGELTQRPAAALAERLGTDLVDFPGGHVGLSTHPAEFGAALAAALRG